MDSVFGIGTDQEAEGNRKNGEVGCSEKGKKRKEEMISIFIGPPIILNFEKPQVFIPKKSLQPSYF